jgi:hypothetical protein
VSDELLNPIIEPITRPAIKLHHRTLGVGQSGIDATVGRQDECVFRPSGEPMPRNLQARPAPGGACVPNSGVAGPRIFTKSATDVAQMMWTD